MERRTHNGFTLIELSIVLVIIGLLIGGIVMGRDLIEVAKVRAELSQLDRFRVAESSFKAKYGYIPGDIPATLANRFRLIHEQNAALSVIDGNGFLDGTWCGLAATTGTCFGIAWTESHYYFPQLSGLQCPTNAAYTGSSILDVGLLPVGLFSGISCSIVSTGLPGTHFPRSKINPQFGIIPVTAHNFSLSTWYIVNGSSTYGNWMDNYAGSPSLTPLQAYQLDSKVDDGVPSSGSIRAFDTYIVWNAGIQDYGIENDDVAGYCVNDAAGTAYNLDRHDIQCAIVVKK